MLEHNFTCCRNNLAEQRIRTPDLLHTGCGSLPLRYMDMCADEWLGFSYPRSNGITERPPRQGPRRGPYGGSLLKTVLQQKWAVRGSYGGATGDQRVVGALWGTVFQWPLKLSPALNPR